MEKEYEDKLHIQENANSHMSGQRGALLSWFFLYITI